MDGGYPEGVTEHAVASGTLQGAHLWWVGGSSNGNLQVACALVGRRHPLRMAGRPAKRPWRMFLVASSLGRMTWCVAFLGSSSK